MRQVVYAKFNQNVELRQLLVNTYNKRLEVGNAWRDEFWGVCNEKGENNPGKILMTLRVKYLEKLFEGRLIPYGVAVIGGRDFNDKFIVYNCLSTAFELINQPVRIVSGGAKGADSMGEQYANDYGLPKLNFPAKWDDLDVIPCKIKYREDGGAYNALAGMNRNIDIINNAELVIAFWDGQSTGTKDFITSPAE